MLSFYSAFIMFLLQLLKYDFSEQFLRANAHEVNERTSAILHTIGQRKVPGIV